MSLISLRVITVENWRECVALQVADGQEDFVTPNVLSLAQSKFEVSRVPLAVYAEETMVGFVMYNQRPLKDGSYRLSRLMVDRRYQGHGYGRATVVAVLARMRQIPGCTEILLEYAPTNIAAARLYASLGFEAFGKTEYGIVDGKVDYDIIARLKL